METLSSCPICDSKNLSTYLKCKDYTVSKKEFTIVECKDCGFKFTNPRPLASELGAFYQSEEYVSHSNTHKGLINKIYQLVRTHTLKQKVKLINTLTAKGSVLDIGCGTGEFLNACKVNGWKTTGIEPEEKARTYGKITYNLDIKEEAALNQIEHNSLDIISLWHVLEHVPNLNERVLELKKLIKPSGSIIIAVPNCSSLDAQTYGEQWAAYDVPRHLYHFTPATIEKLFFKHGLTLRKILPMKFDSYYVSMLSEKYLQEDKKRNASLLSAILTGWKSNLATGNNDNRYSSQIYIFKK